MLLSSPLGFLFFPQEFMAADMIINGFWEFSAD